MSILMHSIYGFVDKTAVAITGPRNQSTTNFSLSDHVMGVCGCQTVSDCMVRNCTKRNINTQPGTENAAKSMESV